MSEKTISHVQGKGSISHNNRDFVFKNVDTSRTPNNIIYVNEPIGEAYEKCFGEAVERFNEKQNRNDRKIKDGYYEYLFNKPPQNFVVTGSNKQKSFYEALVQIGDKDNSAVGTPDGELAVKCLDEYMKGFAERNSNFYVFNAVLHLDEATPHLHIDYIPIGHYNRGIDTQNGLAQALKEMGYGGGKDAINRWRLAERAALEKTCRENGIEIAEPVKSDRYSLITAEYKAQKDAEKASYESAISGLQSETEILQGNFITLESDVDELLHKKMILEGAVSGFEEIRQNAQRASVELRETQKNIEDLEIKKNTLQGEIEPLTKLKMELDDEIAILQTKKDTELDTMGGYKAEIELMRLQKENSSLKHENSVLKRFLNDVLDKVKVYAPQIYNAVIDPLLKQSQNRQQNKPQDRGSR